MNKEDMARISGVVACISHPDFEFNLYWDDTPYLRVLCPNGRDTRTGARSAWRGRKWILSQHMTDGEIVQTALKAVLTAMEHEAREVFTYKGVSVFDPHYDIEELVALRKRGGIRGRDG